MQWEKPTYEEVSLACEISSYANAELPLAPETRTAEAIASGCGDSTRLGKN